MSIQSARIASIALATFFLGCASGRDSTADEQRARGRAQAILGAVATIVPNATAEFYLCTSPAKERPGVVSLRFLVIDVIRDSVILERDLENATVAWHSATQIVITQAPGAITGNEEPDALKEIVDLTRVDRR